MRILTSSDLQTLLDFPSVIDAVETAYQDKGTGQGVIWPMIYHEFISDQADMDIRSGYLKSQHAYGVKLLSWFAENEAKGLPELNGTVTIYDDQTGLPKGVVNAAALTGYRTGAAGAVASRLLANPDATSLLIVGAGTQAPYQIMAQLTVLPHILTVTIVDLVAPQKATQLAETLTQQLSEQFLPTIDTHAAVYERLTTQLSHLTVTASDDLENATKTAQVIVTATPSTKAMIQSDWVQPGTHLNTIGADMTGKQEVDENIFKVANSYVDDRQQAAQVGETQNAIHANILQEDQLTEIGDLLANSTQNQWTPNQMTLFDSTGIALQDIAAANLALEKAETLTAGHSIDL